MSGFDNEHDNASWASAPGSVPSDWEFAAAAVELALIRRAGSPLPALPDELAGRIGRAAPAYLPRGIAVEARPTARAPGGQSAGRSWLAAAGWWTAACLAGVLAWQWSGASRIAAPPSGDGKPPVLAELRGKLLAEDPEAVTVAWKKAGDDPAIVAGEADLESVSGLESVGALGDVVWSSARQQGYMRFRGLAANDPTVAQYQLWIFDAERDEAYPVDGGVFDVPAAGGDVVVGIDPRLRVSRATAFAITVEKPGGVVVSSRKRLPLLAAVP
jgi:hypothetical protein